MSDKSKIKLVTNMSWDSTKTNECIAAYKANHGGDEPKLNVAQIEECAKKMGVEITSIDLYPAGFEAWYVVAKAIELYIIPREELDFNTEIIGVNFKTRELELRFEPR